LNSPKIKEKVTKHQRVAYSFAQIFAEVKVQKKRILVRFFGTNASDPKNIVTNIPATHRWQHDKEIAVDSLGFIDYAMPFVEASYRSNRSMLPAR
jgi:predicted transport protein